VTEERICAFAERLADEIKEYESVETSYLIRRAIPELVNEAIEECANAVWDKTERPSKDWLDSITGQPGYDPIQVTRMQLAVKLRSLKLKEK
jgi:hypothetical protein